VVRGEVACTCGKNAFFFVDLIGIELERKRSMGYGVWARVTID
jgi:hypothetical protein